jgi:hypothetical protein
MFLSNFCTQPKSSGVPPRDPSITQEKVINFLRAHGYEYRDQAKRTVIYRRGLSIIHVPRSTTIAEDWVRAQFQFIDGVTKDDINEFLAACRS